MVMMAKPSAPTVDDDTEQEPAPGLDLGSLPRHLGYALRRAQIAVFDNFIGVLADLQLRPAQYSVLLVVEENPGRKQTEIAAALGIQRPNFVAMLDGLQKRGLVTRARSPLDRRSHSILLTPAGSALLAQAREAVRRHERGLCALIGGAEHDHLLDLLWRLTDAIERNGNARRSGWAE